MQRRQRDDEAKLLIQQRDSDSISVTSKEDHSDTNNYKTLKMIALTLSVPIEFILLFAYGFVLQYIFMLPYCGFLFRCGCTFRWRGGSQHCNAYDGHSRHKCPWYVID
jgi:hypothetical protein